MGTLFWRQLKDRRWAILLYVAAGIAFLWIMVALYPSIRQEADQLNQLIKSMPQGLLKAFDVQDNALSTLEGFIALRYFSMIWPVMLILLSISLAGRSLAGEIEHGTAELMLARPVSRLKLFASRYLFGLFAIAVFTLLTIIAVWPLAHIYNITIQLDRYAILTLMAGLYGLAVFSLSLLVSAIFSEQGKVSMIIGSLLVLMYFLNIVAALKDSLADLKYTSFFYYFDYQGALNQGTINITSVWVFGVIIILSTILGAVVWNKRDV